MSGVASISGVQMNSVAFSFSSVLDQPIEQQSGKPLLTRFGQGSEVVNVKYSTPGQEISNTETCRTCDPLSIRERQD